MCVLGAQARLAALAVDQFGCWVVEKLFSRVDVQGKVAIAAELTKASRPLSGNQYGVHVDRHCRLEFFARNRAAWMNAHSRGESRRASARAVLDEITTVAAVAAAPRAATVAATAAAVGASVAAATATGAPAAVASAGGGAVAIESSLAGGYLDSYLSLLGLTAAAPPPPDAAAPARGMKRSADALPAAAGPTADEDVGELVERGGGGGGEPVDDDVEEAPTAAAAPRKKKRKMRHREGEGSTAE